MLVEEEWNQRSLTRTLKEGEGRVGEVQVVYGSLRDSESGVPFTMFNFDFSPAPPPVGIR